jgi:hypothetical protein
MLTILPQSKVNANSSFDLRTQAFDYINYRPNGAPPNDTLNPATPKGVLGGSVATCSGDYESDQGKWNSPGQLGLYIDSSEGGAYENAPGPASGKVAIYMQGGIFDVFLFETYGAAAPYNNILASYTYMKALYASPFGLLTPERPSTLGAPYAGVGVDTIVAHVVAAPTAAGLKLGIKLVL